MAAYLQTGIRPVQADTLGICSRAGITDVPHFSLARIGAGFGVRWLYTALDVWIFGSRAAATRSKHPKRCQATALQERSAIPPVKFANALDRRSCSSTN